MIYNKEDFQFGAELEFGDINKKGTIIPDWLGSWEWCESDIINLTEPYFGMAADPKGEFPPVGGEINTVPTIGWNDQLAKINHIIKMVTTDDQKPTISHRAHTHIHVHVPGMIDDVDALRKLGEYIFENQQDLFDLVYPYDESAFETGEVETDLFGGSVPIKVTPTKEAARYLKSDGARLMPEWVRDRLIECTDFEDFYRSYMSGESRKGMPIRYGVNAYCLKHTKTVEFRCFRGTLSSYEMMCCFEAVTEFMNAALNTGEKFKDIAKRNPQWEFPPMIYNHEAQLGFEKTKVKGDFVSGKRRKFVEL